MEHYVEQDENYAKRNGHDQLQTLFCAQLEFVFAGPFVCVTRGKRELPPEHVVRLADESAVVCCYAERPANSHRRSASLTPSPTIATRLPAPGPGIGAQFWRPIALHPASRVNFVQGMAVLVRDERDDGAISVLVINRREELWRVHKFRLVGGYNQPGIWRCWGISRSEGTAASKLATALRSSGQPVAWRRGCVADRLWHRRKKRRTPARI